jgi:acetyl esterase/lipase
MRPLKLIMAFVAIGLVAPAASGAQPPPLIKDVAYGPEEKQKMDIYPVVKGSARSVVLVHGGGWATNDKSQMGVEAKSLQREGIAVFNVNYRLDSSTVQAFPMEVEDVEAATRFAIAHASQYNTSSENVVYVGTSAGGQLVGAAAERLNEAASGTIKAVVTLSGPFDFPSLLQDDREGKFNKTFSKNIPQALGCSLETTCKSPAKEALATQWSPAKQLTASNCPAGWLIFNSQDELITLDQPAAMKAALEREGCAVSERLLAGTKHAVEYWGTVRPEIVEFIRAE